MILSSVVVAVVALALCCVPALGVTYEHDVIAVYNTTGLHYLGSVVVDGSGNVFISDQGGVQGLVWKLSPSNEVLVVYNTSDPYQLALDATGQHLYVTDNYQRVLKMDVNSNTVLQAFYPPDCYLTSVAVDSLGRLYVTCWEEPGFLLQLSSQGAVLAQSNRTVAGVPLDFTSVVIDASDFLYVTDGFNGRIIKMDTDFNVRFIYNTSYPALNGFQAGWCAVDWTGAVYAPVGSAVYKIGSDNVLELVFNATGLYTHGVALGSKGNLYVLNSISEVVLMTDVLSPPKSSAAGSSARAGLQIALLVVLATVAAL